MRDDIRAAIEAAACAGNDQIGSIFNDQTVPTGRAIGRARNTVSRFLDAIEDESLTVLELRQALDE